VELTDLQTALIEQAQINFISQNLDIIHLAIDKMQLNGWAFIQPFSATLAAGATNPTGQYDIKSTTNTDRQRFSIPDGEIWVLGKIEHRDIEPSVFNVKLDIDGKELFPTTLLESAHFLMSLPKAVVCMKYFTTVVSNTDAVGKTYRHTRYWFRYSKPSVNAFLSRVGMKKEELLR
jgi:hypothetical protein